MGLCVLGASVLMLGACQTSDDGAGASKGDGASASSTALSQEAKVSAVAQPASDAAVNLDVQAHRGGRGEHTEESREAFEHALKLGVNTLELDIVMSHDGVPVVWHDPEVKAEKCEDTEAATPGDSQFPYVGKLLHDLTFEQLSTLRCDKKLEDFPDAKPAENNRMLQLADVFRLAKELNPKVRYNIETKIEAEHPEQSAPAQEFVDAIMHEVKRAGVEDRVTIQSFDWTSLEIMHKDFPQVPTVALYDETTWKQDSAWLGSVHYDDVNGDALEGVKKIGASVVSPGYAVPYGVAADAEGYHPVATKKYVEKAHELGLKVIPWTVNDEATMRDQLAAGVDGIISDYPTKLVEVARQYGWKPQF